MRKGAKDPFAGRRRCRLPAIHLITALEGEVPLREALAGFFFVMLHDLIKHRCSISAQKAELREATRRADGDDASFLTAFGKMPLLRSYGEEWSFLGDDDAYQFFLLADAAIEQVQWWIAYGVEPPRDFSLLGTTLVTVPPAVAAYLQRQARARSPSRRYVATLRREIG